jgi:biotin-(acetyl-CoA carboxylase) ligase
MARYREKSQEDIAWNDIRRRLTRELDANLAAWREKELNKLVTAAWDEFTASMNKGVKVEVEPDMKDWISQLLDDEIEIPTIEGVYGAAENRR